jgi:hypothetical protein
LISKEVNLMPKHEVKARDEFESADDADDEDEEIEVSDGDSEEESDAPLYECPICGAEVEEEGYCKDCEPEEEVDDAL